MLSNSHSQVLGEEEEAALAGVEDEESGDVEGAGVLDALASMQVSRSAPHGYDKASLRAVCCELSSCIVYAPCAAEGDRMA